MLMAMQVGHFSGLVVVVVVVVVVLVVVVAVASILMNILTSKVLL